jgi:tRNA threonylcarbamoyladenosine biosynthesis protein TsaE
VHVDAYRLGGAAELDDLDLDDSVEDSVTVVEWGRGLVEQLTDSRLEVLLQHPEDLDPPADGADDFRMVTLHGHGARWEEPGAATALAAAVAG